MVEYRVRLVIDYEKEVSYIKRIVGTSKIISVEKDKEEKYTVVIDGEPHTEKIREQGKREHTYLNEYLNENPGDYLIRYNIKQYKGRRALISGLRGYIKEVHFVVREGVEDPKLQIPFEFEGWDKIIIVGSGVDKCPGSMLEEMEGYNQNNKHHTLTLAGHTKKAIKEFEKEYGKDKLVTDIIKVHDYGKMYTRVERDDGGSSYYGHENVGAYKVLEHLGYREDKMEIAKIVQHHMQMGDGMTKKTANKIRNKVGERGYTILEKVYYGDRRGK